MMGIGGEMYSAKASGTPQPTLVQITDGDGAMLRNTKKLILDMTHYEPQHRIKADTVLSRIISILGNEGKTKNGLFCIKTLTCYQTTLKANCKLMQK